LRMIFGEDAVSAWIGRSIYTLDAIGPYLKPLIERMLSEGQPFEARESCYAPRPESPNMWVRVSGTSIRNMDGQVAGGVITVQNVTDVKRAEAVLERERDRADADSRMKTELIATLSHELRTPVGTIRGYAEMLDDHITTHGFSDNQLIEFVAAVRERASDLERLVSDLIEFAHLETGLISIQRQELRLDEVVRDVVDNCVSQFENPVDVDTDLSSGVYCIADGERLKAVLVRVIHNALKFTAEGRVTIRTDRVDDCGRIQIQDTGIGIDPEYVASIFDPFAQADPVLNRRFEGAGLGLAVSKRVIARMGGNIIVRSRQGHGTTVIIELPSTGDQDAD
ncbi:MAG: HAMP domain-containing histidine kinase, partial [Rhodothermia bacterium]|nr:HAMP domain-containing histidine kinase [Rhodothermia bacterium]